MVNKAIAHQRERVRERQHLGQAVRNEGSELIGNSEPAKNHGTIAIAGTAPMYSSCFSTRLASVSCRRTW